MSASVGEGAESEEGAEVAAEEGLPFPTARVVKILKENMRREHQIKSDVKAAANKFLGELLSEIAKAMDSEDYFTLSIEHFNKAARKYREVDLWQKRLTRLIALLEKQRAELEEAIASLKAEL